MLFRTKPEQDPRLIPHTIQVPRCVAFALIPLADRLFGDDDDGDTFQQALRPFFLGERPRIEILRGDDTTFYLEGPKFVCGEKTYPLGAEVFVDNRGWISLGPVEADSLLAQLRASLDVAAYKWLVEHDLAAELACERLRRDRKFDDPLAIRRMVADAERLQQEGRPNRG